MVVNRVVNLIRSDLIAVSKFISAGFEIAINSLTRRSLCDNSSLSTCGMDVVKAVQGYITKIVNGTSGIKVLLLDNDTVSSGVCRLTIDTNHFRCNNSILTPKP